MRIKNNTQNSGVWAGQTIEAATYYTIPASELSAWQINSQVLTEIGSGNLVMNNDSQDITIVADALAYLLGTGPKDVTVTSQTAFAAKNVGTKKLYKRVTGISQALTTGSNNVIFTVPYPWVKITGAQLIGGELGDTVSLYILDSTTGTYTTVPNYQLNQFGYSINVAKDFYESRSQFDADLYINMQIKIVYNSVSNKTIGVNFIMDEVKD